MFTYFFCVYLTTYRGNKLPPFYIGSSSVQRVLNGYRGSVTSKKWKSIWKQELRENPHLFETKILCQFRTREEATAKENKLQRALKVVPNSLYINESYASINGYFGRDISGELNPMFGKSRSTEVRERLSSFSGENHSQYGTERSVETKEKISQSLRGDKNGMFGKSHKHESKLKMSESRCGEGNHFYGRHHSEESRHKISEAKKGKRPNRDYSISITRNYDETIYHFEHSDYGTFSGPRYQLAREYSLSVDKLKQVAYGSRKSHKGWRTISAR